MYSILFLAGNSSVLLPTHAKYAPARMSPICFFCFFSSLNIWHMASEFALMINTAVLMQVVVFIVNGIRYCEHCHLFNTLVLMMKNYPNWKWLIWEIDLGNIIDSIFKLLEDISVNTYVKSTKQKSGKTWVNFNILWDLCAFFFCFGAPFLTAMFQIDIRDSGQIECRTFDLNALIFDCGCITQLHHHISVKCFCLILTFVRVSFSLSVILLFAATC